jgi:hypothetical protein
MWHRRSCRFYGSTDSIAIRVLHHPSQYWGWRRLLEAAGIFGLIMAGIVLNRRLMATTRA